MSSILLLALRAAMIYGGALTLLVIVFSGSAASIAVRDWTIFAVLLGESLLIGWLSARTLDRFRVPKGTHLEVQHSSRALRYGIGTGLLLAVVLGAVLIRSEPKDRVLAALCSVIWVMLTFGFAGLMWGGYLGSKLVHRFLAK
jgi:hypothetical protein